MTAESRIDMLYVVTGGSGSGKSALAEAKIRQLKTDATGKCYYVATMFPSKDAETQKRIARHRKQRKDGGYETIECPYRLRSLAVGVGDIYLLECMSNLLANEMFMPEGSIGYDNTFGAAKDRCEQAILQPIYALAKENIVIVVTNEVFSDGAYDGETYSAETKQYVELLGYINTQLAACADAFVEAVCGIPVLMKGEW